MNSNCVFCRIINKQEKAAIQFEDSNLIIFDDIKPAATNHFLVCPKTHIADAKGLTKDHTPMVEDLINAGKRLLEERNVDVNTAIMGFHWPPFNSIKHLHLHVIAPQSDMGWLSRAIFKPNSLWFATSDYVLDRLSKL